MKYVQKNPVPLPESGPAHRVATRMDSIFDWEYALRAQELMALYEKGKAASWNAVDLAWDTDVDIERIVHGRQERGMGTLMNDVMKPPRKLDDKEMIEFNLHMNAFMLSQFLHGEQGALLATAKIVMQVPSEEAKFYASNQVADEARHVEVYHRYLTEKLALSYEIHPSLDALLADIISDSRWDITYLGMQIMVEGLALAAFGMMKLMMQDEPLIQDITARIMADEARHVAFGVLSLEGLYKGGELGAAELREREEFLIQATHLMHDRLLAHQVFDRLGWDKRVWVPWMQETPFQRGFRQMLFSKIVPNLARLGLLTPRVREEYDKLGLLRFEGQKDSIEDPEVTPPHELVQMLAQYVGPAQEGASTS